MTGGWFGCIIVNYTQLVVSLITRDVFWASPSTIQDVAKRLMPALSYTHTSGVFDGAVAAKRPSVSFTIAAASVVHESDGISLVARLSKNRGGLVAVDRSSNPGRKMDTRGIPDSLTASSACGRHIQTVWYALQPYA